MVADGVEGTGAMDTAVVCGVRGLSETDGPHGYAHCFLHSGFRRRARIHDMSCMSLFGPRNQ